mmetsp:Transcript_70779/g.133713  ORF Transcript_70779/g.133713 Transcript_70779/m.133713 type:complete len:498 (+) Transcript_70779:62-1555(+)
MSTSRHSAWLRMQECELVGLRPRARSAPCRPACSAKTRDELNEQWSELQPQRRRSPQSPTRNRLSRYSMQDFCGVLRNYGMPKLCCDEDRRLVDALIPLPATQSLRPHRSFNYFARLSWQELVGLVRRFAARHTEGDDGEAAAYLVWVCETFQKAHLRNQAEKDAHCSVLPWRMLHCCSQLGILDECCEIERRLDRNELVIATRDKSMLVKDEMQRLFQLVPTCRVVPFDKFLDGTQSLERSALLYVTGHHTGEGMSLNQLDVTGIWLIFLNMCLTEALARQLVSRGALNVVYWPSVVPEAVAVDFGVSMVARLFTCSIKEAVSHATSQLSKCEHPPVLISKSDVNSAKEAAVTIQSDTEQSRSVACPHCGALCSFAVPSDATGAMNLRCEMCFNSFDAWPCRRCERVFFKHHSLAAHMGWHGSAPRSRQACLEMQREPARGGLPPGWRSEVRYYKSGTNLGKPYERCYSPGGHVQSSRSAAWRAWESRNRQTKAKE